MVVLLYDRFAPRYDAVKQFNQRDEDSFLGKPLAQGRAEADKCAWVCEYYAEQGEEGQLESLLKEIREAALETLAVEGVLPWREEQRQPPLAELGRERDVLRSDRCDTDRDALLGNSTHELEGLAEPTRTLDEGQLVAWISYSKSASTN